MKVEWREKLSQAEIEVSMERAKIARERKELEAEFERLQDEIKQTTDAKSEGKKPLVCKVGAGKSLDASWS